MASRKRKLRIVITGAAGRVCLKLVAHFATIDGFELVLIDRAPGGNDAIHEADLRRYDPAWTELFSNADAVVHLAGEAQPGAPWASQAADNLEPSLNVFRAAARNGVRCVVYASSMQTMLGYRYAPQPIAADAQPRPVSFYGAAKLFCEAMAGQYAEDGKFSAICLRLGGVETGNEPPARKMSVHERGNWLATSDLCQAFEKAILAEDVRFAVLPVASDNFAMPWDISETRRTIGYAPSQGYARHASAVSARIKSALGWTYRRYIDPRWRDYWD
ncbi:MAG: NAD-dependent epimerase/dehydratase family protein [Alphaproteobacteria bacterium]